MTNYIAGIFLYGIPVAVFAMFVVSLCRFIAVKRKQKNNPESVSPATVRTWLIALIIFSAVLSIMLTVIAVFAALIYMAVAFM